MNTTPDLAFAKTCEYCKDTYDSFGRYVSTYCHNRHIHLKGFTDSNPGVCCSCPDYKQKKGTHTHTPKRPQNAV